MLPEDIIYRRRATAPRPLDERLPDGRTVGELLAGSPIGQPMAVPAPSAGPMAAPPGPPAITYPTPGPTPPGSVHLGNQLPADASNLQRLLAERDTLSQADPSSRVKRTGWGYEQLPPEQSPSRLRHAGIGAAQGAMIAGQSGDPWATLAGAAVGALTGGVSPNLIQAFQRRQEMDRNTGDLSTEQALQLRNAQIGSTEAEADYRRLEPYLKAQQLKQEHENAVMLEEGRNARTDATNRTRVQTATEANRLRQAQLSETQKRTEEEARHNRATEARPTGTNERTVNGAIYTKDQNGVWRLAPGSPPPEPATAQRRAGEKADDRDEKGRQAQSLYQKGSDYWDQAQSKRTEADRLGKGPDGAPSRIAATRNEDAIKRLLREAEQLEGKTRDVQIKGDLLYAESQAGPSTQSSTGPGGGKAFNLRQWKADHPNQDSSTVVQRARSAGMRIIE